MEYYLIRMVKFKSGQKLRAIAEQEFLVEQDGQVQSVSFVDAQTVLEAIRQAKIAINHSCGGMGTCGTCRVEILSNLHLSTPRTEVEAEMASDRSFGASERLACQMEATAGLKVRIGK